MNLSESESFSSDILQESICSQHSGFLLYFSWFLPVMQTLLENTNFHFLKLCNSAQKLRLQRACKTKCCRLTHAGAHHVVFFTKIVSGAVVTKIVQRNEQRQTACYVLQMGLSECLPLKAFSEKFICHVLELPGCQ